MTSSVRSRLDDTTSTLLEKSGRFSQRVGGRLIRMSHTASPWRSPRHTGGGTSEGPVERAERLGYVQHGEFGLKLAYDPDVLSEQVIAKIERGSYERYEGRRAVEIIEAGDRVVELGAGLGFLSALILQQTDVADYQMVEADPRLADVIRRTHELNGVSGPAHMRSSVATCDPDLLAQGDVEFHVGAKFCASSIMGVGRSKGSVRVPVESLTELIAECRSNVLIADIEGAETGVFNGTPLGSIERILMEIHPHRIGDGGVRKIFADLDAVGFVYDIRASAGAVLAFHRAS